MSNHIQALKDALEGNAPPISTPDAPFTTAIKPIEEKRSLRELMIVVYRNINYDGVAYLENLRREIWAEELDLYKALAQLEAKGAITVDETETVFRSTRKTAIQHLLYK